MDNVTHTLVGLMIARAAGNGDKRLDLPITVALAANAPDLDGLSMVYGGITYLEIHRSYMHALAFAPLMALLPPLLMMAFRQRFALRAYVLSLIGVLSHLALDWTNVYGIRLFLPFSARWLHLDITDIVDPWILAILIVAIAAPALAKLVSSEIGAKSGEGTRRGWAVFALLALFSYEGLRFFAHQRAIGTMEAYLFDGAAPKSVTALPHRYNPMVWRGIIEGETSESGTMVGFFNLDLTEGFDPRRGRVAYSALKSPAMDAAKATRPFQVLGSFSQLPFWKLTPQSDGLRVELIDLRFGTPEFPGFEASAVVDPKGEVHDERFGFGALPVNPR